MGVNDLWQILEPVKEHIHLQSLGGKTIAVDLSLWVCEAQTVKKMMGAVTKPHLRNLFFRISYLTQMDVKLVFVMEGEPPKLKADVMSKRNQIRYGPSGRAGSQKAGRSHFKSVLRECLTMLECLGIPWVQAAGEAEAMCAYLDATGHVDGCLTNDGDAFLYGAQTVYRNFTMNAKDPHVDCYTMASIKSTLGLDRDALVGLAILLGCDYLPKGVPGVGKEQALKLIQILKGQSLLQRFNQWTEKSCYSVAQPSVTNHVSHCSVCCHPGSSKDHERNGCKLCNSDKYCEPHDYEYCCPCEWHQTERERQLKGVESSVKRKACSCEGFPFPEVIQEFLSNKDKVMKVIRYQRPDLLLFQSFTLEKMEWPNHYACEKLLVLLTRYDMIERKLGRRNSNQLQPIRIVKNRIRNGVHCFEIEWEKPEHYAIEDKDSGELDLLTIEEESLFEAAYPEIVAAYQKEKLETKGKKQKCMKIKPKENDLPESDDLKSFQSLITLKPTCEIFPKQNSKLNLEISPDPTLPQESISASLNDLLLSEDSRHLNKQQLISSPRPLALQQVKDINKSLISESRLSNTKSHDISMITDLHLSTIDWENTSFSNSPAIQKNAFFPALQSDFELEPLAIPEDFGNIPEQASCESEEYVTNTNEVLSGDLQDLPLKERIRIKSSYEENVQTDADLKTLSLLRVKGSCIANSSSDCLSRLSKDFPRIHLQNEYRNTNVLQGDQKLQENYKVNTSIPHCFSNPVVKTSKIRDEPPNTALDQKRKVDMQTAQKVVMKSSVCLDRYSSDEESTPVFGKCKFTAQKVKHSSQKHNTAQSREHDNKLSNPKIHSKETKLCVKSHEAAEHQQNSSSELAKSSQNLPQYHEKGNDSGSCLDSPLPLYQRLKLKFQNT